MSKKIVKKVARILLDLLIVFLLFCFVVSLIYFINGSAEMMPTAEQQEKARIGAAVFMIATGIPCAACVTARILLRK